MKTIIILIASILFSILFYGQSVGLNLLVFSVLSLAVLLFFNLQKFKEHRVLLISFCYLLSAAFVFINDSALAILSNCLVFFTLVGAVSESQSSIYVKWFNGLYSSIAGFFHRNIDRDKPPKKSDHHTNLDVLHLAKMIGIPLVFIVIFSLLYRHGNPVFETIIGHINFEFINLQWLLFTLMGYYLFSNISRPVLVEPVTSEDLKLSNHLFKTESFSEEKLKKEQQLGTTLLGLLNLLLLFYIITDIASLQANDFSKASELSSQVHNGINTLIASIIIAICIILYFFRGNLNFYAENKRLKNLSFIWMLLNLALVVLIAIKNRDYISNFGLTYKRIGVHIYIFMTAVGLLTTFLKVLNIKNLTFLFRRNTQVAFVLLIVFSAFNWDHHMTIYNLSKAETFDINYLINLSDNNAITLYQMKDAIAISETEKRAIEKKYRYYISKIQHRDWQEFTYANYSVDHSNILSDSE